MRSIKAGILHTKSSFSLVLIFLELSATQYRILFPVKMIVSIPLLVFLVSFQVGECFDVICYYTSWAQYREGATFHPENIDPSLCDMIIYAFAMIDNNKLTAYDWTDEVTWPKVTALKEQNANLKVLLAVGGWNQGSTQFTPMSATEQTRKTFIDSAISLLNEYNFDGLDLDWEYPNHGGLVPAEKANFVALVKELKSAFAEHSMIVTAAIGAGKPTVQSSYDLPALEPNLDHIGVMSYDFFVCSGASQIRHHASLYPDPNLPNPEFSVAESLKFIADQVTDKSKIVMGLPTYGRSFGTTVANPSQNSPASGQCPMQTFTKESGMASYYEVCKLMKEQGFKRTYNDVEKVPSVAGNNMWIGYDDIDSLTAKVEYAKSKGYGGVMIWTLDFDDFNNQFCSQGKYPLINAIRNVAKADIQPATTDEVDSSSRPSSEVTSEEHATDDVITSEGSDVTTESAASTNDPGSSGDCSKEPACQQGLTYYSDKASGCTKFNSCSTCQFFSSCPAGLLFSDEAQVCNWADAVQCH